MSIVVRLQTNKGIRRITIQDLALWTLSDLKRAVWEETGVNPADQELTLERNGPLLKNNTAVLKVYPLQNGSVIYLKNPIQAFKSVSATDLSLNIANTKNNKSGTDEEPIKLTPQCLHNATGRCLHCDPARKNGHLQVIKPKCNHGPGFTCMNCSQSITSADAQKNAKSQSDEVIGMASPTTPQIKPTEQVATWLCNHPTSSFCPKCIPADKVEIENKDKLMQRDTITGEMRTKVNFIPFKKFLADSKPQCANRHDPESSCPMCLPPAFPSYAFNPSCTDPHPKYPRGQCTKCMPANIKLALQKYRHVDGISIPVSASKYMYSSWLTELQQHPGQQRVWLLFGRVIDERAATEDPLARRAVVSAIYQPPQTISADGQHVEFDLTDPSTEHAIDFAKTQFNSKLVGWVVCTPPLPDDKKYGGKAVISTPNLTKGAALQWSQSKVLKVGANKAVVDPDDKTSYRLSEFVTVVLEQKQQVEPEAFMVSDQGMCMARDAALVPSPKDNYLLQSPIQGATPVPSIIFHQSALDQGIEYIPDMLVVKVRTMTAASEKEYPFVSYHFPSNQLDKLHIRGFLKSLGGLPLHSRLSDFNLLLTLSYYLNPNTLQMVCRNVLLKKPFTQEQEQRITDELKQLELI